MKACQRPQNSRRMRMKFALVLVSVTCSEVLFGETARAQSNSDSTNALVCQYSVASSGVVGTTLGQSNAAANNNKEAIACGIQNNVRPESSSTDGEGNMAFGMYNSVRGAGQTVAFGYENTTGGTRNTVVGILNQTGFVQGTHIANTAIIGSLNQAYASRAVIVGSSNIVSLSPGGTAGQNGGIAIGHGNGATGVEAIAIGHRARTGTGLANFYPVFGADYAIAIGSDSLAQVDHGVAIGSRSVATQVHTGAYSINGGTIAASGAPGSVFSVGDTGFERQVQNVAAGVVSASSTDAVNGSQLFAVGTLVNQNSALISSLTDEMFDLRSLVNQNTASIERLGDQAFAGVALALSMGGATLPPGKSSAISVGMGTYKNQEAFSASAQFLVNPNMVLTGGLGVTGRGKDVGTRVGLTIGW